MRRYMGEQEWLDIFGDNLRDILEEQWTSRSEIAEAIGVSEATISRYINKTQMPSVRSLINMSWANFYPTSHMQSLHYLRLLLGGMGATNAPFLWI